MGAHRNNPIALAAANGKPIPMTIPDLVFGFEFEVTIEVNAVKMAEIKAAYEAHKAAGGTPDTVPDFPLTPEDQDYVVYNRPTVIRPSRFTEKHPKAVLRWNEHFRCPLREILNRAEMAFGGGQQEPSS